MRTFYVIASVLLVLYAGACIALYTWQRELIYFPTPATDKGARMLLQVPGADLLVAAHQHAGPKAILYFGGNAEDVSGNLPVFARAFPEHAIYLLHYRGYGGSSGKPTEAALHADALALYEHVARTHPDVSVIGRSLGSGVAVRLAASKPVSRLVLVTPYDSIANIAARQFRWFPVNWLLTDKFESWRHAGALRSPALLLMADGDQVIARANTQNLFDHFNKDTARLVVIPGTDHNDIGASPLYLESIQAFLK